MKRLFALALIMATPAHAGGSLSSVVDQAAARHGVPRHLARAVIMTESGFNPHARNSHAIGLGQIKCQTARGLGYRGACNGLLHPVVNADLSMRYLRQAISRGGAGCAGLALYNRGVFAKPRCTAYGRKVLRIARAGE
ncbi:transglycosylase SLT domain-containing protein [Rhodoblastus acidophilus]|uniref:Transglycosylase SLT domain-containing protein n=1 Tax=Rhodoblastus acidophilus TaxID=1074 RepID=A0A6N8DQC4_RHOAC|nr:transglycosylase SLT domain-containing protein [Rhodoblastus acidophilus]MCW2275124.1 soluble lytic murein transglycosylase-like protein [Rhodoblastus acidophilus]MTV31393.1 transglycosylase SLT domain-containing protein [Rhodoblastus acidophilus]